MVNLWFFTSDPIVRCTISRPEISRSTATPFLQMEGANLLVETPSESLDQRLKNLLRCQETLLLPMFFLVLGLLDRVRLSLVVVQRFQISLPLKVDVHQVEQISTHVYTVFLCLAFFWPNRFLNMSSHQTHRLPLGPGHHSDGRIGPCATLQVGLDHHGRGSTSRKSPGAVINCAVKLLKCVR